jgi:hypothetical protein
MSVSGAYWLSYSSIMKRSYRSGFCGNSSGTFELNYDFRYRVMAWRMTSLVRSF